MDSATAAATAADSDVHARRVAHSADLLDRARVCAVEKHAYKSEELRTEIEDALVEACGKKPYAWQVDVAEALWLGLDTAVIAGTGAGKTMPFVMPLLVDKTKKKKVIIISPLNELELDQARRFKAMELTAAAVNGDVYDMKLHNEIVANKFRVILTSPEMCLKHAFFSALVRSPEFMCHVLYLVVDEAHCVTQWGDSFRKGFSELVTMRSHLGSRRPFLLVSATLAPFMLADVFTKLEFSADTTYIVNLGNDRPNITLIVHRMKAAQSSLNILEFLVRDTQPGSTLPRVIVFFNTRDLAFQAYRYLQECAPNDVFQQIDYLRAGRSRNARRRVMQHFRERRVNILCATEAAGMGMDIPDIDMSIQFLAASSLSVWIQRAGRAGRTGQHAFAILLVEPSIFNIKCASAPRAAAAQPPHDIATQVGASTQPHEGEIGRDKATSGTMSIGGAKGRKRKKAAPAVPKGGKGTHTAAGSQTSGSVASPTSAASKPQSRSSSDVTPGTASPTEPGATVLRGRKSTADGDVVESQPLPEPSAAAESSVAAAELEDGGANIDRAHTLSSTGAGPAPQGGGQLEYKKRAEDGMRSWAGAETCRRIIADEYFGNPPRPARMADPSPHPCCDNCVKAKSSRGELLTDAEERVLQIINLIAGRADTGREDADEEDDEDGDNVAAELDGDDFTGDLETTDPQPSTVSQSWPNRRSDHLLLCRARLVRWRIETWTQTYTYCAFSHLALLPDKIVTSLATQARLQSVSDIKRALPLWPFADEHGAEILELLAHIDIQVQHQKDVQKKAAEEAKAAKVAERKEKQNEAKRLKRQKEKENRDVWRIDTRYADCSVPVDSELRGAQQATQPSSVRWAKVVTGYSAS